MKRPTGLCRARKAMQLFLGAIACFFALPALAGDTLNAYSIWPEKWASRSSKPTGAMRPRPSTT